MAGKTVLKFILEKDARLFFESPDMGRVLVNSNEALDPYATINFGVPALMIESDQEQIALPFEADVEGNGITRYWILTKDMSLSGADITLIEREYSRQFIGIGREATRCFAELRERISLTETR